jgi:hypothetical protein
MNESKTTTNQKRVQKMKKQRGSGKNLEKQECEKMQP